MIGLPVDERTEDSGFLSDFFPGLDVWQKERFARMQALYEEWNAKINVISRKDIGHLYSRHVLHSLSLSKVVAFRPGARVLDVGTGGGFPGIPLAVLFPETEFHLVDSIGKKIKVVEAVASALELKNVTASQCRVETLRSRYDFIVSRAVTTLPEFYSWVGKLVSSRSRHSLPNGILYLKGGDLREELAPFGNRVREYAVSGLLGFPSLASAGKEREKDGFLNALESFYETKKVIYVSF